MLAEASSPWFIFRCHDDLSSLNFAEELLHAVQDKNAELGAPTVETYAKGELVRLTRPPLVGSEADLGTVRTLLFHSHQAWFFSSRRRHTRCDILPRVWAKYDSPWGPDHLSIYPLLITNKVAMAPEAVYIQRITPKAGAGQNRKPRLRDMMRLRSLFIEVCSDFRKSRGVTGLRGAVVAVLTWFYTGKRVFKVRNIIRYALLFRW